MDVHPLDPFIPSPKAVEEIYTGALLMTEGGGRLCRRVHTDASSRKGQGLVRRHGSWTGSSHRQVLHTEQPYED